MRHRVYDSRGGRRRKPGGSKLLFWGAAWLSALCQLVVLLAVVCALLCFFKYSDPVLAGVSVFAAVAFNFFSKFFDIFCEYN